MANRRFGLRHLWLIGHEHEDRFAYGLLSQGIVQQVRPCFFLADYERVRRDLRIEPTAPSFDNYQRVRGQSRNDASQLSDSQEFFGHVDGPW